MKTKNDGKIMRTFLLYSFAFAWITELLIIAAYRLGLMSGKTGIILHYVLIIAGPGLSPAYPAYSLLPVYCWKHTGEIRGICSSSICRLWVWAADWKKSAGGVFCSS